MRLFGTVRTVSLAFVLAAFVAAPVAAQNQADTTQAQPAPAKPRPTAAASDDRLFLSFAEEATLADSQWWEGQLELAEFDRYDAVLVRGVVAFQPLEDLEVGGRVGFGSTDADGPGPDGSGATDLDLWAKYVVPGSADTQYAFGALVGVPTGDDTAGLGADSFGLELFGSLRHEIDKATLHGSAGVRLNEDGSIRGFTIDGETSPFIAGAVRYPVSDRLSVIGEARFESERFDGADSDFRVLGGVNWHLANRGVVRGALAFGGSDLAPDTQLIFGYAQSF